MHDPHLALLTRLDELDAYTHNVLHQFPKLERHLLCADMRATMGKLLRLVVVAWKRRQKSSTLFELDVEVEVFRGLIRKAHRLGYINVNRLGKPCKTTPSSMPAVSLEWHTSAHETKPT